MADIEILETYTPLCHDCGWTGEEAVYFSDARTAGDAHECPQRTDPTDRSG